MEDFFSYESYGNPYPGGTDAQPAEWVDAVTAVSMAHKKVKHLIDQEMQADQERKSKQEANKNKGRRR